MTLDKILELPAADIALISDADLESYLRPWFPLTRPRKIPGAGTGPVDTSKFTPEIQAQLDALKKPSLLKAISNATKQ
jgi:hypothetical protein